MYDRILLPTDGSPGTEAAAGQAFELARRFDAHLDVLHVVDTAVLPLDTHSQAVFDELEAEGLDSVESLTDRAREFGVEDVTGTVLRGDPDQVIVDYVANNDVDLVVMGTHGRTGLDRIVLGSVTERVLRRSTVPVLTVPLAAEHPEGSEADDESRSE
ncbi:MAG: universal stress protein [Halobacteriaceae archaeon]